MQSFGKPSTKDADMNIQTCKFALRPLVLLLGAGSALGIGGIGSGSALAAQEIAVSYRDLDLSSAADTRVLYRRLQRAAGDVCGVTVADAELARHLAAQRCYAAALEHAVMQIDSPQLLATYRNDPASQIKHG
jgi:UrcA family protein